MPPNQVMIGLAMFLSVFVMAPVWTEVNETAIAPLMREEIVESEAWSRAVQAASSIDFTAAEVVVAPIRHEVKQRHIRRVQSLFVGLTSFSSRVLERFRRPSYTSATTGARLGFVELTHSPISDLTPTSW